MNHSRILSDLAKIRLQMIESRPAYALPEVPRLVTLS